MGFWAGLGVAVACVVLLRLVVVLMAVLVVAVGAVVVVGSDVVVAVAMAVVSASTLQQASGAVFRVDVVGAAAVFCRRRSIRVEVVVVLVVL